MATTNPPITLDPATDRVIVEQEDVLYHGRYGDRPLIVSAAIRDMVQAYPQLDGEPLDWTARMRNEIEREANIAIERGRVPDATPDGSLVLALALDEIMPPEHQPGLL